MQPVVDEHEFEAMREELEKVGLTLRLEENKLIISKGKTVLTTISLVADGYNHKLEANFTGVDTAYPAESKTTVKVQGLCVAYASSHQWLTIYHESGLPSGAFDVRVRGGKFYLPKNAPPVA